MHVCVCVCTRQLCSSSTNTNYNTNKLHTHIYTGYCCSTSCKRSWTVLCCSSLLCITSSHPLPYAHTTLVCLLSLPFFFNLSLYPHLSHSLILFSLSYVFSRHISLSFFLSLSEKMLFEDTEDNVALIQALLFDRSLSLYLSVSLYLSSSLYPLHHTHTPS